MSKLIINCETSEVIERELDAEELAQFEIDQAAEIAHQAKNEVDKAAEATAKAALLAQLGITEEQAKLLLS